MSFLEFTVASDVCALTIGESKVSASRSNDSFITTYSESFAIIGDLIMYLDGMLVS